MRAVEHGEGALILGVLVAPLEKLLEECVGVLLVRHSEAAVIEPHAGKDYVLDLLKGEVVEARWRAKVQFLIDSAQAVRAQGLVDLEMRDVIGMFEELLADSLNIPFPQLGVHVLRLLKAGSFTHVVLL